MTNSPYTLHLSRRDSERLADDLLNPPAPSPELVKAAEAYREAIEKGWLRSLPDSQEIAM